MLKGLTAAAIVGAVALAPAPAAAKSKNKNKGKVVFVDTDRDAVRGYWIETYGRGKCPPGLAKKHNGCLPPGQAKKRYVVGRPLPGTIVLQPLPPILLPRLRPAPGGYEYWVLDGDVLLLAVAGRVVADAIVGLFD